MHYNEYFVQVDTAERLARLRAEAVQWASIPRSTIPTVRVQLGRLLMRTGARLAGVAHPLACQTPHIRSPHARRA